MKWVKYKNIIDSSKNFYRDVNIYENVVKIIKSNFSTSVEHMPFVMFIGNYLVSAGRIRKNKLREITCWDIVLFCNIFIMYNANKLLFNISSLYKLIMLLVWK